MNSLERLSLSTPIAPDLGVESARDLYLVENGFTLESYDEPWTYAKVLGLTIRVPNTPKHRWAIQLHDLHHVATGFGTNLVGEGEISAWELRGGLRGVGFYISALIVTGTLLGFLIAPRRAWRAWKAGGRNLLGPGSTVEDFLPLNVGELRERLGLPARGLAVEPRRLHEGAPTRT